MSALFRLSPGKRQISIDASAPLGVSVRSTSAGSLVTPIRAPVIVFAEKQLLIALLPEYLLSLRSVVSEKCRSLLSYFPVLREPGFEVPSRGLPRTGRVLVVAGGIERIFSRMRSYSPTFSRSVR